MVIELGHLAAILALALSGVGLVASVLGARWDASFLRVGRASLYAVATLLVAACGTLVYAFLTNDFSVLYVAQNSNSRLPTMYQVAALWGGHEGSLLFWATILSFFGALAVYVHWKRDPDYLPSLIGVFSSLQIGFLSLVIILSSPFERLIPAPMDGRDLNPLLQDPQMAFHPPFLFAGYTAFAVPFAFAMAVLLSRKGVDRWIFIVRRWIIAAWALLTVGIALGGHWAYRELGWGGYWAWDPVENASFMPWLVGTALLHSIMVQEQRKTFRVWNISLAILAFALSILGTFLVRSGIISSVHAFASDPSRGLFLLGFFFAVLIVAFGLLVVRSNHFASDVEPAPLRSRETLMLANNWIFLVSTFTVLLGTLYPLFMDLSVEQKVTVAAPFFNKTFIPIMIVNIVLMAVAPMLPWRLFQWDRLKKVALWPGVVAVVGGVVAVVLGVHKPIPLAGVIAAVFGIGVILTDWWKMSGARARSLKTNRLRGFARMATTNRRRFGGLVAHLGILVMAIGFVGSYAYQTEAQVPLRKGERAKVGEYEFQYTGYETIQGPNYQALASEVHIFKAGEQLGTVHPQKRVYLRSEMPLTEPHRLKTLTKEVYVAVGDIDRSNGNIALKIYLNPLVHLVFGGVIMLVLGALISVTHGKRRTT